MPRSFQPRCPEFPAGRLAAFTGASYNSLLFAAVFIAEATGSPALVVPGLIASSAAFLVAAGISNSESQRRNRITDEGKLSTMPCGDWMTRRIVVASPTESLARFHDRAILEHSFDELPVIAKDGTYLGMAGMKSLRMISAEKWSSVPVAAIMDGRARTVCAYHSMKIVEQEFAQGAHDYLPVVDPASFCGKCLNAASVKSGTIFWQVYVTTSRPCIFATGA